MSTEAPTNEQDGIESTSKHTPSANVRRATPPDAKRCISGGHCKRAAPRPLAGACVRLALLWCLSLFLCLWTLRIAPWSNPTALTIYENVRHHMTPGGMPPAERLWLAASRCDVDAVHRLVGAGAPVGRDLGGGRRTALHAAAQTWTKARGDCIATAAALIRAGADLRLSVDGQTPIDLALAQDRLLVAAYKGALVRRPLLGAFLVSALSRGHAL